MISIIAAIDRSGTLAVDGVIPWHCKEDLQNFKRLTYERWCIVGRKTYEKLPLLPARKFLVLTRSVLTRTENKAALQCKEISDVAYYLWRLHDRSKEVFVIGGRNVYQQFLPIASRIYLTVINSSELYQGITLVWPHKETAGNWKIVEQHIFNNGQAFYYVMDRL